jgi:Fe(3+) dicitrate transport protein
VPDIIDPAMGSYKNRQVDIDRFNSRTAEIKLLHRHSVGAVESRLAAGAVYMNSNLHRQQLGKGTTAQIRT